MLNRRQCASLGRESPTPKRPRQNKASVAGSGTAVLRGSKAFTDIAPPSINVAFPRVNWVAFAWMIRTVDASHGGSIDSGAARPDA